jgi:hypothetical protein
LVAIHKLLHWGVSLLTQELINLLLNIIIELPLAPNPSLLAKQPNLSRKSRTKVIKLRLFALRVVRNKNGLVVECRFFHFGEELVLETADFGFRNWGEVVVF